MTASTSRIRAQNTPRMTDSKGAPVERRQSTAILGLVVLRRRSKFFGFVASILSLCCIATSYLIINNFTPIEPTRQVVDSLTNLNLAALLFLFIVLVWEAFHIVRAWRSGEPGANLHIKASLLFGFLSGIPAFALAVAATMTFNVAMDNWFSQQTGSLMLNSRLVASAYWDAQYKGLDASLQYINQDLRESQILFVNDQRALSMQLRSFAEKYRLNFLQLVSRDSKVLGAFRDRVDVDYPILPETAIHDLSNIDGKNIQGREVEVPLFFAEEDRKSVV